MKEFLRGFVDVYRQIHDDINPRIIGVFVGLVTAAFLSVFAVVSGFAFLGWLLS